MSEIASGSDEGRTAAKVRIAILSSHRGAHLQTLLEDPVVGPWVALVVADRPDAYALRHAEWHGVPGVALRMGRSNLDLFDRALARVLEEHSIDYVVVAGFPRIVGTETVHSYEGRIAKVHHSLLPEFPGPDPVGDVLKSGSKQTGVTIHMLTRDLEVGSIVSQQSIEIHDDETWHTLVERLHELEVRLLPTAVLALVEGRVLDSRDSIDS
jgi:phosphoribosylglycinamide formyltransferase-1